MFAGPVQRVIEELARLPGIGRKSAQRLAFHLLATEEADAQRLAHAIIDMRDQVHTCSRCFNVAADDECAICQDTKRDSTILCVVERPQDIVVIERTQEFRGRYHVLGGALSPIAGIGASELHISELLERVAAEGVEEVIIATNPTIEGDTTAMYLARELKALGVRVTRLASGLPVGGDLDYADELTLGRALIGRREMP
jgi:recombination protein RecR